MRLILFILLLSSKLLAQNKDDYIKYYNLCNRANFYFNQKDHLTALNKYDSAFKLVHYAHVSHFLNASVNALKAQNKKAATNYLRRALLNGIPTSELSNRNFTELSDFKAFKQLKDSADILHNKYLKRINTKYAKQCDSLFYIDQVVIRNIKTAEPLYKTDMYVYANERPKYDSINFQFILKLIDKYGFPSEEKVGPQAYNAIKIVIHHSARMPVNKDKLALFKTALFNGEYLPIDYCWMYDQYLMNSNEKPLFYFRVGDSSKLTEEEKNKVDQNRKKYGLKKLDEDTLYNPY